MTDTNDLRDSLRMPPRGRWTAARLCGAIINRSYEHAHNQVHQADYEQFATASPGTAETCKICGILINRSTKTRTAAVTGSCRRSARRR